MFVPRIGQRLFLSLALGLFILPSVSWATTVTIPHPFDSTATYTNPSNPGVLPSLSVANSITINNNGAAAPTTVYFGTLNLNNNDLVLIPTVQDTAHATALYNAVNDMARSGSNSASWNGPGIMSQMVATDWGNGPGGLPATGGHSALGVGVLLNDAEVIDPSLAGQPIYGPPSSATGGGFDGYTNLTQFDVLVKYTFLGDVLLRGFVDTFDTAKVNNNFDLHVNAFANNTWGSGDFFYEQSATGGSPPDVFDTSAVNNAFDLYGQVGNTTYPLTASFGGVGGAGAGSSVPEPASIALLIVGAFGAALSSLRRWRKQGCKN